MPYSVEELLEVTRSGFQEIGYRDELLFSPYGFADFLSPSYPVRTVSLAGFAQQPPSYRTVGFGVLVATDAQGRIADFTALGAPHLFVIDPVARVVHRWKVHAARESRLVETIRPDELLGRIQSNREEWGPESVLRAKTIGVYHGPEQLDFYDVGLLPVLEQEAHRKLDQLLGTTIATAVSAYREGHRQDLSDSDYRGLFRLVFRLVAAKLLADRQHPGSWLPPEAQTAVANVDRFYFRSAQPEVVLIDPTIQQLIWDEIRTGFHLENLSLETLAYVYENTFVSTATRRVYDTHATPPEVAEFIVRKLPFESIGDPQQRTVFEPFAGHAPFLTAAIGRLRTLLPFNADITARHEYLVRMLTGMELDSFAREVARYSLILADYPNPNGWRIAEGNAFTSAQFARLLARSNIVLCNPPFGQFTSGERAQHPNLKAANKAVEALLRVLDRPPQMLGFVLPRSFTDGQIYKHARKRLAETYASISMTALPDSAFRFSEAETVVVIASDKTGIDRRWHRAFISQDDYGCFWQTGRPTWEDSEHVGGPVGDDPQIWKHPLTRNLRDHLRHFILLGQVAEIHRGLEYSDAVEAHVSDKPRQGYTRGLHHVDDGLEPYIVRGWRYLDTNPRTMRWKAYQHPWDRTKVIANTARISRGPWRIIAAVDTTGLVCYQSFHGIWPKGDVPAEVIAAVLNGPVANALLNASGGVRHIFVRDLKAIPLPQLSQDEVESLRLLVQQYYTLAKEAPPSARGFSDVMVQIDTLVLSGYQLPGWLAGGLLDYIGTAERPKLGWCLVDQLRKRHGSLVDKKFLDGLSEPERTELERINRLLDAAEASYYAPIKDALARVGATPLERT